MRASVSKYAFPTVLLVALVAAIFQMAPIKSLAAEDSLLSGRVVSSSGQPLAGIPVRSHRENSNIAVSVYTNSRGDYLFPAWSDLSAGAYSIGVNLPDFAPVKRDAVAVSAGKTARVDFTLQSRQPSIADATA